jgi:hypothetical protein
VLTSPKEDVIISSMGWADKNCLQLLETGSGITSLVQLSEAKYLTLHEGRDGYFAILHHHDGDVVEITAHSFSNPPTVLSRITITAVNGKIHFDGDSTSWTHLPKAYIAYLKRPGLSEYHLLLVDPVRPALEMIDLAWYDDTYDKGYQGVTGVVEVPNRDLLIITVQRDSHPVLVDLTTGKMVGKLSLADRSGNPTLRFRRFLNQLWADDYDTLIRLDPADWKMMDSRLLQGAGSGCDRQFIGMFGFNAEETLCAVARPYSGDVVALSTKSFKITHTCKLGHQPLLVSLLANGTVWSRDWKTGAVLKGTLKRKWFS